MLSLARFLFINLITIETIVAAITYLPSGPLLRSAIAARKVVDSDRYLLISIQVKPLSAPLPPYKDKVCEK